jgi:hypothetical protein
MIQGTQTGHPMADIEGKLLAIWREVLKSDTLGPRDQFLDVGGNSVSVFIILERLRSEHGATVDPGLFFQSEGASAEEIAKHVKPA